MTLMCDASASFRLSRSCCSSVCSVAKAWLRSSTCAASSLGPAELPASASRPSSTFNRMSMSSPIPASCLFTWRFSAAIWLMTASPPPCAAGGSLRPAPLGELEAATCSSRSWVRASCTVRVFTSEDARCSSTASTCICFLLWACSCASSASFARRVARSSASMSCASAATWVAWAADLAAAAAEPPEPASPPPPPALWRPLIAPCDNPTRSCCSTL